MKEIIKVEGLTKTYKGFKAVDNLNISAGQGMILGLIGANGAGKSTAIECILGTKKADEGQVSILGLDPMKDRKELFEKVGVQFQDLNYQDQIRVEELCEISASLYHNGACPEKLLSKFGIGDKKKSLVKELSGGQRQKLFIVLALICDPEVMFLDELTTGLDTKSRREVFEILSELKEKGLTMVMTSHFMDEVEALCDMICILKQGKTQFYGTVTEAVRYSPFENFEDAYLWYTKEEENLNENV